MKRFENAKMTLFDSTNASFKITIEAQFSRKTPDGNSRDLVYTTERGTSVLNPNIYLTFCYKDDNMNAVYTSYPQLYRLREAFETMKSRITNPDAFLNDPNDNSMSVKQNYADPIILSNIGKNNNWIQLKLEVLKNGENGVFTYTPGVSIQLSTSNGYASLLSEEEFLTIYTIIKDLNLSTLQCMLSLGFLNCDARAYGYSQPQTPYYQQATNYPPHYQQPIPQQYGGQQQNTPYARPRYQNQGYQPRQSYRAPAPAAPSTPLESAAQGTAPVYDTPVTAAPSQATSLPPRGNKPLMNMKAVDDTPVSTFDIDDTEALNNALGNLFGGN